MKSNTVLAAVLVVALVVCGIGWMILPSIQDPERGVHAEASMHVERARRLLHKYDVNLTRSGMLLDQLAMADVDVDIEDPSVIADSEDAADAYQSEHAAAWEAYQPTDWQEDPPLKARAQYGNLARQISEGINERAALLEGNEEWLEEALDAVEDALAVSDGGVDAGSHAEANRLKAVIQFHIGLAESLRAEATRREALPLKNELMALAAQVAELESAQTLVADSKIDEQIRAGEQEVVKAESALRARRQSLATLDARIEELSGKLSAARARMAQAESAMAKLRASGSDLTDPEGSEKFAREFSKQDEIYRAAAREVREIEAGALPNARIDRSGDYLAGAYVENGSRTDLTVEHGLKYYRGRRAVAAAELAVEEQAVEDARSDVVRLTEMKEAFQSDQDRAIQRVPSAVSAAEEAFDELSRIESEAYAMEDTALDLLADAVSAAKQAAGYAADQTRDARECAQGLAPEAAAGSPCAKRQEDGWIGGHIAAQAADAGFAKAWIHYQRFIAHSRNADILAKVKTPLGLAEADADAEREKAAEAHDAGVEEVADAMAELERAHRESGRHWTVVAQQAAGLNLMALFGHPSYRDDAEAAYREAVKGREDRDSARPFLARLADMEGD